MRVTIPSLPLSLVLAGFLTALSAPLVAAPGGVPLDPVLTFVAFTPVSLEIDPRDRTLWVADQYLPRVGHLQPDGAPVGVFSTSSFGVGRPAGVAFEGSSGDYLYISDPDLQRVVRVDRWGVPAGGFTTGSFGSTRPSDLAWDSGEGALYVTDPVAQEVLQLRPRDSNSDGEPDTADLLRSFSTLPLGSANPLGIARDPATGHLFLSDPALDRVFEVTPDGSLVASFDTGSYGGSSVTGLAWDESRSELRLADAGRKILTMTRDGVSLGTLGTAPFGSLSPQGLTFDPATGTFIAVTGERKLIRFEPDDPGQTGSPEGIMQWSQESTSTFDSIAPSGVGIDPTSGDRFISDNLQHRVFRVDRFAGLLSTFDTGAFGSSTPSGLAVGPAGQSLYLSDNQARKIFQTTPSGTLLASFSTAHLKRRPHSEPPCNDPRGVAYDASLGHLFIVDFRAARVFEVTGNGTFVSAFSTSPGAPSPTDLAVDPAGDRILVADSSGYLAEFSRAGALRKRYAGVPLRVRIQGAASVSVDPATLHRLVLDPDQDSVFFLSLGGEALGQISLEPYGIRSPSGAVWSGTEPRLYVADRQTNQVDAISPGIDGAFGTGDDAVTSYATAAAGSSAPVGLTLDRSQGSIGWADEQTDRVYWITSSFGYLGSTDLAASGATELRGIDRDPSSRYLFMSDGGAGVLVADGSGKQISSQSASSLGVADLGGLAFSPAEGSLLVVDRGDRTLVTVDMRPLFLAEVAGTFFAEAGHLTWLTNKVFTGYQVYRGEIVQLREGQYGGCFWVGIAPPAADEAIPAAGGGWFYLVVGTNPTGVGSLGRRSDGLERPFQALAPACP